MTTNTSETAGTETPVERASLNGLALMAALTVKDVATSRDWYQNVLGFEIANSYEREGTLMSVSLKGGNVRLLINQDNGAKGWERSKGEGVSLHISVEGVVDDVASRIRENGWPIDNEPTDTPWGMRMFRLRDPDGFLLTFSSEIKA